MIKNSSAKGDKFARDVKDAAIAKGLDVLKVAHSGHMGRRGGIPADVVIDEHRVECKRYANGISTKRIEAILTAGDGIYAVATRTDRGIALITMGLEDWFDMLAEYAPHCGSCNFHCDVDDPFYCPRKKHHITPVITREGRQA